MSASPTDATPPLDLSQVKAPELGQPSPELLDDESDYLREQRGLALEDLRTQIKQRKVYAFSVFVLLCVWLVAMFGILLIQGLKWHEFYLSDNVLLALIGGTTANVFGLFLVVMNYLFPKK